MQDDYDNRYLALELLKVIYNKQDCDMDRIVVVNDFKNIMMDLNDIKDIDEIISLRKNQKDDMLTISKLKGELIECRKQNYNNDVLQNIISYLDSQKINMEPNTYETLSNMINHLV